MKASDVLAAAALIAELGRLDADDATLATAGALMVATDNTLAPWRSQAFKSAQLSITMQINDRRQTILDSLKTQDIDLDIQAPAPTPDVLFVDQTAQVQPAASAVPLQAAASP